MMRDYSSTDHPSRWSSGRPSKCIKPSCSISRDTGITLDAGEWQKLSTGCEATKKRESRVSLHEKRDDKRRATGRSDLPSDDVGLHRRRGGLRRDRVTPWPYRRERGWVE